MDLSNGDFSRYIGIDYSGAETPEQSLKGLCIYEARGSREPTEVAPPPSPRKYWTRRGIAEWLVEQLASNERTIVGIDHAFSFPLRYFEHHRLVPDWPLFLDDFQRHWPTDHDIYVDFVRDGIRGNGAERMGNSRWRRFVDIRARAKSPFHFDCPGSVAKSTHAGLPWLLYIRRHVGARVHFWPFDGWDPRADASVIVEVYPVLWAQHYPRAGRNSHQHDAYAVTKWLQQADAGGELPRNFNPNVDGTERGVASVEGWILGVAPALTRLR